MKVVCECYHLSKAWTKGVPGEVWLHLSPSVPPLGLLGIHVICPLLLIRVSRRRHPVSLTPFMPEGQSVSQFRSKKTIRGHSNPQWVVGPGHTHETRQSSDPRCDGQVFSRTHGRLTDDSDYRSLPFTRSEYLPTRFINARVLPPAGAGANRPVSGRLMPTTLPASFPLSKAK